MGPAHAAGYTPAVAFRLSLCSMLILGCASAPDAVTQPPDAQVAPDAGGPPADGDDIASPPDTANSESPDIPPATSDLPAGGPDAAGGPPAGSPGAPCSLDSDCTFADGVCLDWADGYCTRLNCSPAVPCPDGSSCASVSAGVTACLDDCSGDCRAGYGCKPLGDQLVCLGLDEAPSPPGGPCTASSGCEGSASCLGVVADGPPAAGGYCASTGCDVLSCEAGTACVHYNGVSACLASCSTVEDCAIAGATERSCGSLPVLGGGLASVCLPASGGTGVGGGCSQDLECDTGTCRIVAKGKCVGATLGCFGDDDCPGATVCEVAPAYERGVCTLACGEDIVCPGQSACAPTPAGDAYCQLPCDGADDVLTCDEALGERCRFGDPVASTASGGKYLCTVVKSGDAGEPCTGDEDCKAGICVGTCAPLCTDIACGFGTICGDHKGTPRCLLRCFSPADCPNKAPCAALPGTAAKVCAPSG